MEKLFAIYYNGEDRPIVTSHYNGEPFRTEDEAHLRVAHTDVADELEVRLWIEIPARPMITNAPEAYDGFGTYTLDYLPGGYRRVSVRDEHRYWQEMRYRSGLYAAEEENLNPVAL
jgi:hypothetical protein